jgi:hypothetical protein
MATFVLAIVWLIGAFACYYIAKARNVKPNFLWNVVVVFLGPLAIPLMLLAKPVRQI